jgi:hypothetical protein
VGRDTTPTRVYQPIDIRIRNKNRVRASIGHWMQKIYCAWFHVGVGNADDEIDAGLPAEGIYFLVDLLSWNPVLTSRFETL